MDHKDAWSGTGAVLYRPHQISAHRFRALRGLIIHIRSPDSRIGERNGLSECIVRKHAVGDRYTCRPPGYRAGSLKEIASVDLTMGVAIVKSKQFAIDIPFLHAPSSHCVTRCIIASRSSGSAFISCETCWYSSTDIPVSNTASIISDLARCSES